MKTTSLTDQGDRLGEIMRQIEEKEAELDVLELAYSLQTSKILKMMKQAQIDLKERELELLRRDRGEEVTKCIHQQPSL